MADDNRPVFGGVFGDIVYGLNHDVFETRFGRRLLRAYRMGITDDPFINREIQGMVHRYRVEQAIDGFPFRAPRLEEGDIVLGHDFRNRPIRIPLQWLVAGFLLVANTGSGKTNLFKWVVLQIARWTRGLWAVDLNKRDLRHLKRPLERIGIKLLILNPRKMRFNLLQADHCDPR